MSADALGLPVLSTKDTSDHFPNRVTRSGLVRVYRPRALSVDAMV